MLLLTHSWGIHHLRFSFIDFIRFLLLPMQKFQIWGTGFKDPGISGCLPFCLWNLDTICSSKNINFHMIGSSESSMYQNVIKPTVDSSRSVNMSILCSCSGNNRASSTLLQCIHAWKFWARFLHWWEFLWCCPQTIDHLLFQWKKSGKGKHRSYFQHAWLRT